MIIIFNFQVNESTILVEFETPGSEIPRSMKSNIYLSPLDNNMTIVIHANRTLLEAHGKKFLLHQTSHILCR